MIETERLILRRWQDSDHQGFHAMGNDPEVMRYLGPPLSHDDVETLIARQNDFHDRLGYCFWAVERCEDGAFLGFCGIKPGAVGTPIEHHIEIGWRLARPYWGSGYAREAAQASLDHGWATLDVPDIAAMTVLANDRSWGLMERLGMKRVVDGDFDHPSVAEGDPLRRHILYRIGRPS